MIHGHICGPRLYEYTHDGRKWFFEFGSYIGPWPLRQSGEPYKRAGDKFYAMFRAWKAEPDPEAFRVGGGCMTF